MSTSLPQIRTPLPVLLLCVACMTLEGYDVLAYGAALPVPPIDATWGLTATQAGPA